MKESNIKKKKKLYEGKSKIIYETDNEDVYVQEFKDDAAGLGGAKKGKIKAKGSVNSQISGHLFNYLENYHVNTHFIKQLSDTSMLVKRLTMIPIEVVMRNIATGSLVKRYSVEEGSELEHPILEYYPKDDEKHDSLINEHHIIAFGHANQDELKLIQRTTQKINAVLKSYFHRRHLLLVDFKLEFGRNKSGRMCVGDEISPDTCSLWDSEKREPLTKDRSKQDLAKMEEAYQEIFNRLINSA